MRTEEIRIWDNPSRSIHNDIWQAVDSSGQIRLTDTLLPLPTSPRTAPGSARGFDPGPISRGNTDRPRPIPRISGAPASGHAMAALSLEDRSGAECDIRISAGDPADTVIHGQHAKNSEKQRKTAATFAVISSVARPERQDFCGKRADRRCKSSGRTARTAKACVSRSGSAQPEDVRHFAPRAGFRFRLLPVLPARTVLLPARLPRRHY